MGGLCFFLVTGIARLRRGTLAGYARGTPVHAGHAGERWLRSGEDAGHARGMPAHAGHAGERWLRSGEDAGHTRGTPAHAGHAGECLFTLGNARLRSGEDAGVLLRSSWFASRVLVYPEDLSVCRLWSK